MVDLIRTAEQEADALYQEVHKGAWAKELMSKTEEVFHLRAMKEVYESEAAKLHREISRLRQEVETLRNPPVANTYAMAE